MSVNKKLQQILLQRKEKDLLRSLSFNRHLIDFSSNDYLGFARDEEHKQKVIQRFSEQQFHVGSTGSRLISGNSEFVEELESRIAQFHRAQAALIFNSGYDANVGFFSSVPKKGDTVIYDELIHASIRDGIRLGLAKSFSFKHNDIEDLKKKITKAEGDVFVVVEAVYSMDGDQSPLQEICNLNVNVVVDEAHSAGVFGEKGEGLVCDLNLENKVYARLITYGKAFGAHGAAILGSAVLRDYLVNFARSFIYTTYGSDFNLVAIDEVYIQLQKSNERIEQVNNLKNYFLESIKKHDLAAHFIPSKSLIHCFLVPGNSECKNLENIFKNKGISVKAILSPTIPEGLERLRISIHWHNSKNQIDELLKILNKGLVFID
jgi:8-amino-7-oxononanoate synthase